MATKPAAARTTQQWQVDPTPDPRPTGAAPGGFDEKQYVLFLHLSALGGLILSGLFFLGPLIMWLVKKDQSALVAEHGRAAVNFHLTMLIAAIVSFILVFVIVGIFLLVAVGIVSIVFTIMNAVKASNGQPVHYPLSIPFIKAR